MFQRTWGPARLLLFVSSTLIWLCLPMTAQQVVGPIIFSDVHHDVSPAVRDMPTIQGHGNSAAAHLKHEAEPARRIPLPPGMGNPQQGPVGDAALQSSTFAAPAALSPTSGLVFYRL